MSGKTVAKIYVWACAQSSCILYGLFELSERTDEVCQKIAGFHNQFFMLVHIIIQLLHALLID